MANFLSLKGYNFTMAILTKLACLFCACCSTNRTVIYYTCSMYGYLQVQPYDLIEFFVKCCCMAKDLLRFSILSYRPYFYLATHSLKLFICIHVPQFRLREKLITTNRHQYKQYQDFTQCFCINYCQGHLSLFCNYFARRILL